MRKLIILAILLLSLASVSWAGHPSSLSLSITTSLNPRNLVPTANAFLLETTGYIQLENSTFLLTES